MGDTFSGGWIFAFLIIAVLFGGGNFGFGGGNATMAGYATMADVNSAINNQSTQQALGAISLSSANNNYETAQLINNQTAAMMATQNSNLVNAIQGFNQISSNMAAGFSNVTSQIADLGYKLDNCCCSIKTMMLENRLQDVQAALVASQTNNAIAAQSQYLLSQLGTYTPV
jgi:hypothetical protein